MAKFIICNMFFAFVLSCSNDDNQIDISQSPEIPESATYDLNNDSVDDFTIKFSKGVWDGVGASGGFFSARFEPIGENLILQEYEENVATTFLFAQMGDSIQRKATEPQSWTYHGRFASLYQGGDGVWSKEWQIESKSLSNLYYVGVQIAARDDFMVGWLKLEINKNSGKIEIRDNQLTFEEFIVIDR